MNDFLENIQKNVNNFIVTIANTYKISEDKLKLEWQAFDKIINTKPQKKSIKSSEKIPESSEPKTKPTKEKSPKSPDNNFCTYTYSRAPRKGEICGEKIGSSGKYCSKHKRYENKEPAQPKQSGIPKPKSSSLVNSASNSPSVVNTDRQVFLRPFKKVDKVKDKGYMWDSESGVVFRSKEDKIAIGRYIDDEYRELNDEDRELCRKNRFKME